MTPDASKTAPVKPGPTCPACGGALATGAAKCRHCGEDLILGIPDVSVEVDKDRHKGERRADTRSRVLFWIGLALFLLGGPMLSLFSLIHNYIGYPPTWQGSTVYEGYGPLDQMFGMIGLAVMAVGIVFLILSLKRREGRPKDDGFDPADPRGYDE